MPRQESKSATSAKKSQSERDGAAKPAESPGKRTSSGDYRRPTKR
jgi:hypothetical protein